MLHILISTRQVKKQILVKLQISVKANLSSLVTMTTPPWPPAAKVKLGCMTFMDFTLGSVLSCNSRNFKTDKQSCGSIFFSTDTSNSCDEELKTFLFE